MDSPVENARYLDNGFWQISKATARRLCCGNLPDGSDERLIHLGKFGAGQSYFVGRMRYDGRLVWSIREVRYK